MAGYKAKLTLSFIYIYLILFILFRAKKPDRNLMIHTFSTFQNSAGILYMCAGRGKEQLMPILRHLARVATATEKYQSEYLSFCFKVQKHQTPGCEASVLQPYNIHCAVYLTLKQTSEVKMPALYKVSSYSLVGISRRFR